jgi:hypothetical protein
VRGLVQPQGTIGEAMTQLSISDYTLIMHGLSIPPETPLIWLQRNACFQDTFIHLFAKKEK